MAMSGVSRVTFLAIIEQCLKIFPLERLVKMQEHIRQNSETV